jgi:putative oxidoreductase
MNKVLWVAQVFLGVLFLMAGGMKVVVPVDALAADMVWVTHVPAMAVKAVGVLEGLGALGLLLPSILRIQPQLTPIAAGGLIATMVSAAGVHVWLGEGAMAAVPLVLGSVAAFIAWGRAVAVPISAR